MCVNEGTPIMSFVLYTIYVEYLCDASYVTWKYRQYRRYHVIFVRKYKTFQKINISGARFNSSGTSFFKCQRSLTDMFSTVTVQKLYKCGNYELMFTDIWLYMLIQDLHSWPSFLLSNRPNKNSNYTYIKEIN